MGVRQSRVRRNAAGHRDDTQGKEKESEERQDKEQYSGGRTLERAGPGERIAGRDPAESAGAGGSARIERGEEESDRYRDRDPDYEDPDWADEIDLTDLSDWEQDDWAETGGEEADRNAPADRGRADGRGDAEDRPLPERERSGTEILPGTEPGEQDAADAGTDASSGIGTDPGAGIASGTGPDLRTGTGPGTSADSGMGAKNPRRIPPPSPQAQVTENEAEGRKPGQPTERSRQLLWKGYLMLFLRAAVFVLVLWIFFTKVLFLKRVVGTEMFPSLKDGDLALGFRLESDYRSGDVILYQADGSLHFGRILAQGGSTVTIDGSGAVLINGILESDEIFFPSDDGGDLTYPYEVPEGSVFVLGDHRTETEDSRSYGAIPMDQVEGKVLSILRRRGL